MQPYCYERNTSARASESPDQQIVRQNRQPAESKLYHSDYFFLLLGISRGISPAKKSTVQGINELLSLVYGSSHTEMARHGMALTIHQMQVIETPG